MSKIILPHAIITDVKTLPQNIRKFIATCNGLRYVCYTIKEIQEGTFSVFGTIRNENARVFEQYIDCDLII